MVTVSAFAQAAALCVSAINPDGSRSATNFEAQGWISKAISYPQLSQTPYEAFQQFGKVDFPVITLTRMKGKWHCMVWQQVAPDERLEASEHFFTELIPAIEQSIHRKAAVSDFNIVFSANEASPATSAILSFDGKDFNFTATEFIDLSNN